MATLQVRELPEPIYEELRRSARSEHRSLSQEAVVVLARGLGLCGDPRERRRKLLREIKTPILQGPGGELAEPAVLIREDRRR